MTTHDYMIGDDTLTAIVRRAKPDYGMPTRKRRHAPQHQHHVHTSAPTQSSPLVTALIVTGVAIFVCMAVCGALMVIGF